MNKQFFAIIALALISQLHAMDKSLYPHDYPCTKHRFDVPYPYRETRANLIAALTGRNEPESFWLSKSEDEHYCQFKDGKSPVVIALKDFHNYQTQELEALQQKRTQDTARLCQLLGKPRGFQGEYITPKDTVYWRNLRERLANPQTGGILTDLEQFPELWKAFEKEALTANILGNRKQAHFKNALLPAIAKMIDAKNFATSVFYCEELDKKDVIINAERAAFRDERIERNRITENLNAANARLTEHQQAADANVAALRELETQKENLLRSMRQKHGQLFDASQTPVAAYQMEDPAWTQNITDRLHNPPQEIIQQGVQLLQDENSTKLCDLIIKTSQVNPVNAKALILTVISHARDATIQAYACPLLEKLKKANARLDELARKSQADAEKITELRNKKRALKNLFETNIGNLRQLADQRNEQSRRMLADLQREISPLQRELPRLRQLTEEQRIEIQALTRALEPRNNK